MKQVSEWEDWQIHQSESDGHLEAWKTVGATVIRYKNRIEKKGSNIKRLVLLARTVDEAVDEIKLRSAQRKKPKELDPNEDPNQTRIV